LILLSIGVTICACSTLSTAIAQYFDISYPSKDALDTAIEILTNATATSTESNYQKCKPIDTLQLTANNGTNSTLIYSNATYHFSIKYPQNWHVEEDKYCLGSNQTIVAFSAVDEFQISDKPSLEAMEDTLYHRSTFWISVTDQPSPYLDTDTLTLKNFTSRQIAQSVLDHYSQSDSENGFVEIKQRNLTVASQPAWKIEYWSNQPYTGKSMYKFEIFTIANGKLYQLYYSALPLNVPTTVPVVNSMLGSFQFID
jgi:hypothetical protein